DLMNKMPEIDVAIVGGGIGGIYTGWRLLTSPLGSATPAEWRQARGCLKVALFEGSHRIGGRLLSARSPHMGDTTVEIGGMRYVAPTQALITGLVERVLRLPYHKQTVAVDSNIAFLRGHLLQAASCVRACLKWNIAFGTAPRRKISSAAVSRLSTFSS